MNINSKKLSGFTLIELIIVLAILSGLAATFGPQLIQQEQPMLQADDAKADISEIKAAANGYFMENRAWPASVNELIAGGYYTGSGTSPFGTNYNIGTNGNNLVISIDTNRNQLANMLAGKVSFGSVGADGETVSTEMGTPSREAIQSFFLARKVVAGCPDCNQLADGTDIDVNNNDLNNIDELDANQAVITDATITNANIDRLEAESINLGANSITYSGNQLIFNAGTIRMNANLSMNGNIIGNGNNISGIGRLEANTGEFNDLTANNATINSISGDFLSFNTGNINVLSGDTLSYDNGVITYLSGDTLNYNSGSIGSLSGNSLNFGVGNVGSLTGNNLTYNSGVIDSLTGNNLSYVNINGTNGYFNYISSNSADFGNLSVTGNATLNSFTANRGSINNLYADNAEFNHVTFNTLEVDDLTASNAKLAIVNATSITTNFLTTGSFSAESLDVTGDFSVGGTLTANNVIVNDKTTTNRLEASSSILGDATANNINVNGEVNASSIIVNLLNADSATIGTVTGDDANFDTVTANQFNGGTFNGSNFTTNQSSVNNNKALIDQYIDKWKACKSAGGCQ